MEFPDLGKHCSMSSCNKLDFLPVKCDACSGIFCQEHMKYDAHQCPKGSMRDVQVAVCPLCNKPVPSKRGEPPDIAVGAHIDQDCLSDSASDRRKIFVNKCQFKGCRQKELIKILCQSCKLNFCLKHRFPTDHFCSGEQGSRRNNAEQAASARLNQSAQRVNLDNIQGAMSEDEALALAIQMSLEDSSLGQPHSQLMTTANKTNSKGSISCALS